MPERPHTSPDSAPAEAPPADPNGGSPAFPVSGQSSQPATSPAAATESGSTGAPNPSSTSTDTSSTTETSPTTDTSSTSTATSSSAAAASTSSDDSAASATSAPTAEMNLFDQLLDAVLGNSGQNTGAAAPAPTPDSAASPDTAATPAASTLASDSSTIYITVNYMFMDGSDQFMPGRSGSLVVTLPNNEANREPRVISQFIQLATRMAYSALAGTVKPHKGVTVEKFRSFEVLPTEAATDATCAICFDPYQPTTEPAAVAEPDPDTERPSKKRKIAPGLSHAAATASESRDNHTAPSSAGSASTTDSAAASSSPAPSSEESGPKYLCQCDEEYPHVPLKMPCGHMFGQSCLAEWLRENTSCPLCRVSVADAEPEAPSIIPISYIRLGGLGGSDGTDSSSSTSEPGSESAVDSFLRRTSRTVFHDRSAYREAPPPPLSPGAAREPRPSGRSNSVAPMIDNILNYFSRARRQRQAEERGETVERASPIFATGVASRRTANGVETVTSDAPSAANSFDHLTSLLGDLADSSRAGDTVTQPATGAATGPASEQASEPATDSPSAPNIESSDSGMAASRSRDQTER